MVVPSWNVEIGFPLPVGGGAPTFDIHDDPIHCGRSDFVQVFQSDIDPQRECVAMTNGLELRVGS